MGRSNTVTITITSPKKATTLTLTSSHTSAPANTNITLTATLRERDTNNPIPNKPIYFYTSAGTLIDTRYTNSSGVATTVIAPGIPGTYSYYAEFPGDDQYEGCGEDANQQDNILSW